jgi:hypothetical protein
MVIELPTAAAFGPGCPWYDLHAHFPPNIDWCEEKLCAIVVTPFNTWTNLAYLIAATLMWAAMRDTRDTTLRLFAPATALTGVTSFVYHQSLNAFSQVLDFVGMYAFCVLLLMANLRRMHKWPDGARGMQWYGLTVAGLTGLTAVSFMAGMPAQMFVALLIGLIIWTELLQDTASRRYFWASVLAMGVAAVFSALDLARVWCSAANHWFQPHGVWHIITALAIYLAFQHARGALRHVSGN